MFNILYVQNLYKKIPAVRRAGIKRYKKQAHSKVHTSSVIIPKRLFAQG